MAPMSVDWENTVLETTQTPVGGIILLLIFFFYIFNPVSAYLRNAYLMHDKNLLHSNIKNKRMKSIELMNKIIDARRYFTSKCKISPRVICFIYSVSNKAE